MTATSSFSPTLCWGVLGTGRILDKLGPSLRAARGVKLVAIASRDRDRAQAAAQTHGAARAHGSYAALVADPEIDVVLNALHNGLHCEWTIRALAAGKHVLCEKPLACTADEVNRMYAAATQHQRWLLEGFMYRFHPQLRAVEETIADGRIGRVTHLRAAYLSRGRERKNPRYRRETGGGALLDLGCYCVNFLRTFAGAEPQRVTGHATLDDDTGIDLTFAGMLDFPNGISGHFAASFDAEGLYSADVIGTEGRIHIPHPWRPPSWPAEILVTRGGQTETVIINPPGFSTDPLLPFVLEIEHLSECVRHHRAPAYPPGADAENDARHNARVLDDLTASAACVRSS